MKLLAMFLMCLSFSQFSYSEVTTIGFNSGDINLSVERLENELFKQLGVSTLIIESKSALRAKPFLIGTVLLYQDNPGKIVTLEIDGRIKVECRMYLQEGNSRLVVSSFQIIDGVEGGEFEFPSFLHISLPSVN